MSQILVLGSDRTDEDSSTYDFYDLDDSMGEDGEFNFENLDHDDPIGEPNNNGKLADYDFGSTDDGQDPESYIVPGTDWDMDGLNVDPRGNPGEFDYTDDGEFSFQNLDNDDTDHDKNNNAKNAQYDYSSLEEGTDPNTYIRDDTDSDMEAMIDPYIDEYAKYDFGEVTNDSFFRKNDPLALEYDFGELDKAPDFVINNYMVKLIEDAVRDAMCDGTLITETVDLFNPLADELTFQYYFNYRSNKVFIEFDYSEKFKMHYNIENITKKITSYIQTNLKYDIGIWPEIIMVEDGVNERCDSSPIITPFVIGYWKSLSGEYEFLTDQIEVLGHVNGINLPTYPEEYLEEHDRIVRKYYKDNYEYMLQLLYKLDKEFNINPDQKPDKSFEDFCELVKGIDKSYAQTKLSEANKLKYFQEYQDIYFEYKDSPLFESKLNELKEKYELVKNPNSYVPKMFQLYAKEYDSFFGTSLPEISAFVYRTFVQVRSVAA